MAKNWNEMDAEAYEAAAQKLIDKGYTRHKADHVFGEEFRKAGAQTKVLGRPLGQLKWTPRPLNPATLESAF